MKRTAFLILLLSPMLLFSVPVQAQNGLCGTAELGSITEQLLQNRKWLNKGMILQRNQVSYVPVKFHLVAKTNGTGRISEDQVYRGLCLLNAAYDSIGLQFYIKDNEFNYIDNDAAYNNPIPGMLLLSLQKDDSAINIFFTGTAGSSPTGTTLGFYSYSDDWIVVRNDQVTDLATMPHEMGHFFSLLHTFNGWECDPYDESKHGNPVSSNVSPCESGKPPYGSVPVELADRSNCDNSGDFICDTEPDYNFGLGWPDCDYIPDIMDPNGDVVNPIEDNYMSYFLECPSYHFTQFQIDLIIADYESPRREYIQSSYVPSSISDPTLEFISPLQGEMTPYNNFVTFDWEDVDGATCYILEISKNNSNFNESEDERYKIEGQSIFEWTGDLGSNQVYYYRITPLSDYSTCIDANRSATVQFRTGSWPVATEEISRDLSWKVFPNPIAPNDALILEFESDKAREIRVELTHPDGRILLSKKAQVHGGENTLRFDSLNGLSSGVYLLGLYTEETRAARVIAIR